MQVVLVMFRDGGERRSFSMTRDMTIIGRREDCDFRIPLGEISRKHCRLIKEEGVLRAEDLGSSNGTYINGIRVQEGVLHPGDTLKVGSVVFVVQIDGVPSDEELMPGDTSSTDAAMGGAGADLTDDLLDPNAHSDLADSEAGAVEAGGIDGDREPEPVAAPSNDDFVITDDVPEASGEVYDPMSILGEDPESSGLSGQVSDSISEDILMDLEAQDRQPKP